MMDQYLTDDEVAEWLGCSKETVWGGVEAGILPRPMNLAHAPRWPESDIQAAISRLEAHLDSEAAR